MEWAGPKIKVLPSLSFQKGPLEKGPKVPHEQQGKSVLQTQWMSDTAGKMRSSEGRSFELEIVEVHVL
jgi:hypothetical protein